MGILHGAWPRVFPRFTTRGAVATSPPRQGEGAPPFGTPPTIHVLGGYWDLPGVIR